MDIYFCDGYKEKRTCALYFVKIMFLKGVLSKICDDQFKTKASSKKI